MGRRIPMEVVADDLIEIANKLLWQRKRLWILKKDRYSNRVNNCANKLLTLADDIRIKEMIKPKKGE